MYRPRRGIERIPLLGRYIHWLHGRWPAGTVEKLPSVEDDFSTAVPGLYVVGDLTGVPLLKLAADSGVRAVRRIDETIGAKGGAGTIDIAIIGGGVSGYAAALEARKRHLDIALVEASEPFSTIVNFPAGKPIYTYPSDMTPAGDLQFHEKSDVKEGLLEDLREQVAESGIEPRIATAEKIERRGGVLEVTLDEGGETRTVRARAVIVAIGRSGNFRTLGVEGEDLPKVYNRLHDPAEFAGRKALVVGGGDSACEAAVALADAGATVTLSYRGESLTRPKPENVAAVAERGERGEIDLLLGSKVERIDDSTVHVKADTGRTRKIANDVVFPMLGREPPLDFFRRSGVPIRGETRWLGWVGILLFLVAMIGLYDWKNFGPVTGAVDAISSASFPDDAPSRLARLSEWWQEKVSDRSTLVGTLAVSMKSRSFYYTLLYSLTIVIFGILRIRRRRTPYVTRQTLALMAFQVLPLFLLPELFLPWLGYNGAFDSGIGRSVGDSLFEMYIAPEQYLAGEWPEWGHPRAYWRAYGFILAWPLMIYNVFTEQPMMAWLVISVLQTFVLIPLIIRRWGKGAYCGWICSCGALAETLGDTQRQKMPHGPAWNRVNLIGQVFLAAAFGLLALRIWGWVDPESWAAARFASLMEGKDADGSTVHYLNYKWVVDILFGGVLGVGLYFKFSGRVWCRFACPLAALMHIYARFSRFAIVSDKKKCISCNVCTSVCHQGIDVMAFANRGAPMQDPQCVRCSACVQSCPTNVLTFGRVDGEGATVALDRLRASPVAAQEPRTADE